MVEDRNILASKCEDIIEVPVAVKGDELNHRVVSKSEPLTNQCREKKTTKEYTAILPSEQSHQDDKDSDSESMMEPAELDSYEN